MQNIMGKMIMELTTMLAFFMLIASSVHAGEKTSGGIRATATTMTDSSASDHDARLRKLGDYDYVAESNIQHSDVITVDDGSTSRSCQDSVKMEKMFGFTPFPENAIEISSVDVSTENSEQRTVTVGLNQKWVTDGELDSIYAFYHESFWDSKCYETKNVPEGIFDEITIYCMQTNNVALLEICVADSFSNNVLDSNDVAEIPECCQPELSPETGSVCYIFSILCEPCENEEEERPSVETPIIETPDIEEGEQAVHQNRTLNETLQMTIEIRDALRALHNYDAAERDACIAQSDTHQRCVYEMFTPGSDFSCECQPTDGALIFDAVDANRDGYINFVEIENYFNQDPCESSFIYGGTTYTGCTADGDMNGREWCSIRTLNDGTHAFGFWKYCNHEDNVLAWEEALASFDTNNDGRLSFDEAITQNRERRRHRRRTQAVTAVASSVASSAASAAISVAADIAAAAGGNCNDCNEEDALACMNNPVVQTIDGECRNYIKTVPFDRTNEEDEHLLYMLGIAMKDVYCTEETEDNYLDCPARRDGTEEWMTQTHVSPYPEFDGWDVIIACLAIAGAQTDYVQDMLEAHAALYVSPMVASAGIFLLDTFLSVASSVMQCERVFREVTDGRDALQWATYSINQGEHEGKTILAYMGTNGYPEQFVADLWSVPFGTDMMRNMTEEAVEVANRVVEEAGGRENVFVTGHSLGGIVAELVCSETGIAGASFAAIGAFDPYSIVDEAAIDALVGGTELTVDMLDRYRRMLEGNGFDTGEIDEAIESVDYEAYRRMLIAAEYNGLIRNTAHAGVKFEVVINMYDMAARSIGSIDGSMCSHIAGSCDIRWTWFGDGFGLANTGGHDSGQYLINTNSYFTRGWEEESHAIIDYNKVFLPGQKGNVVCDACWDGRNEYCASGNCFESEGECRIEGSNTLPTICPANSTRPEQHADCPNGNDDCESGRCDGHSNIAWRLMGYQQCFDKRPDGNGCNEDSDCLSNNCNWRFRCS